jgi:hypothetical protein
MYPIDSYIDPLLYDPLSSADPLKTPKTTHGNAGGMHEAFVSCLRFVGFISVKRLPFPRSHGASERPSAKPFHPVLMIIY